MHKMKEQKMYPIFSKTLVFVMLFIYCQNPKTPNESINFAPLAVGSSKQFIMTTNGATIQVEITEMKQMSDGKNVFVNTYQTGNDTPKTSYDYTDGNFLISSLIDVLDTGNYAYDPQRIGLINPSNNFSWFQYEGDSTSFLRIAKYLGPVKTELGNFENCYGFELYDTLTDTVPEITVIHANGIGWIETCLGNNLDSVLGLPVYLNVNGIKYGSPIPNRDSVKIVLKKLVFSKRHKRISLLGKIEN